MLKKIALAGSLGLSIFSPRIFALNLPSNLEAEENLPLSKQAMLANISPEGAAAGSVVASPSKSNPNYFYYWVRDGALVMDVVRLLHLQEPNNTSFSQKMLDFVYFTEANQKAPTPSGLGEPKFYADGSVFSEPWGRPQNDGPALRALTMTKYIQDGLDLGSEEDINRALKVIEIDLDYISQNWREHSFDLWEEVLGEHFYTRYVQAAALKAGSELFQAVSKVELAARYKQEYKNAQETLDTFWSHDLKSILVTTQRSGGLDYKHSGIDAANILAVNQTAKIGQPIWGHSDSRMMATFEQTLKSFASLYEINKKGIIGYAIGRYPEDKYDGNGFGYGNPWFLTTLGFGEYLHKLAHSYILQGKIKIDSVNQNFFKLLGYKYVPTTTITLDEDRFSEIISRLLHYGDSFLSRAAYHSASGNVMFEQINNQTGFMQGAADLTWSYASHITATLARKKLVEAAKNID